MLNHIISLQIFGMKFISVRRGVKITQKPNIKGFDNLQDLGSLVMHKWKQFKRAQFDNNHSLYP